MRIDTRKSGPSRSKMRERWTAWGVGRGVGVVSGHHIHDPFDGGTGNQHCGDPIVDQARRDGYAAVLGSRFDKDLAFPQSFCPRLRFGAPEELEFARQALRKVLLDLCDVCIECNDGLLLQRDRVERSRPNARQQQERCRNRSSAARAQVRDLRSKPAHPAKVPRRHLAKLSRCPGPALDRSRHAAAKLRKYRRASCIARGDSRRAEVIVGMAIKAKVPSMKFTTASSEPTAPATAAAR